ncbi:MAG: toll/interleukin-1 receptor domain-containing protein, partial [Chloroflexota bacterium]
QQPNPESDVFISYNRKASRELALKIKASLNTAGLEVWLDSEDIPKGVDYKEAFLDGVERTGTVLIILNDDYLQSANCRKEINKAHELQKRVLLVLDKPDFNGWGQLPGKIGNINAISFFDEDGKQRDFDNVMQELVPTVKQIPGYAENHTRYLVSARQWRENDHNINELLQGTVLEEAEQWLKQHVDVPPEPTEAQRDYIEISRIVQNQRDEDQAELDKKLARRQRNLMALLYGGLIAVFVILANFSVNIEDTNKLQVSGIFQSIGNVALEEIVDKDDLIRLSEAIIEGDDETVAELRADHTQELERLAVLYPHVNIYTLTSELAPIVRVQDSIISEDNYEIQYETAQNFINNEFSDEYRAGEIIPLVDLALSETDGEVGYNVSFMDIQDDNGETRAVLVLESPDELVQPIDALDNVWILISLFVLISVILFVLTLFWRNIFGKKKEETEPSQADKEKYQQLVKAELEARSTVA